MPATFLLSLTSIVAIAITWDVQTYYILMGIIHVALVPLGFRLLRVDPEHNGFIGGVIAAVIINVVAYFTRDTGVVGVMIVGITIFGTLAAVSSGDILKSFLLTAILITSYGGVGKVVIPRTPLEVSTVKGLTQVIMEGGMKAEPISEREFDDLSSGELKATDDKE